MDFSGLGPGDETAAPHLALAVEYRALARGGGPHRLGEGKGGLPVKMAGGRLGGAADLDLVLPGGQAGPAKPFQAHGGEKLLPGPAQLHIPFRGDAADKGRPAQGQPQPLALAHRVLPHPLMGAQIPPVRGDEMAGFYYNQGKTDSAEIIAKQVQAHHPSSLSHLVLGKVYYQRQMFDSASVYLQKVISGNGIYNKSTAFSILAAISEKQKKYPEAYLYASLCINAFDSFFQITKTEEVNKIHSLYNYNLSEQENQRLQSKTERQKLLLFQLLFVASLLIGIVIYLLHRLRERRRKYTIREQQLQQIFAEQEAQSSRRILENEQQITLLNEQLQSAMLENDTFKHSLLEAQTKRLGATNEQIRAIRNEQEMRLLAFRHSDIYLHFHHATQSSEITERDWKQLSEATNSTFPNFLRQLYALYPQLSEHELHICYLIKIELKRSIIAELLNRSVSAITNSLSRLYQKIYS